MSPLSSFKPYIAIAVIVACTALGALGAWKFQAATYGKAIADLEQAHLLEINRIRDAGVLAVLKEQARYDQLATVLHDQSSQQFEEAAREKKRNEELIASLRRDGDRRVSVAATSCSARSSGGKETSATGQLVHGTFRAELDPTVAADLGAIAAEGDDAIRKLTACQSYVKKIRE